jgi:mono/diheme cytochrome c family protein
MKFTVAIVALAGMMAFGARGALQAQATKTQWDGIYTEEQAKRGEPLYAQHCAACHGPDLSGGEMAPGLAGSEFASNWNDLSVGDLFDRIRQSMPQNAPGTLSRAQNADIVAFMFQKAGVPAGSTELPGDSQVLAGIKLSAQKK